MKPRRTRPSKDKAKRKMKATSSSTAIAKVDYIPAPWGTTQSIAKAIYSALKPASTWHPYKFFDRNLEPAQGWAADRTELLLELELAYEYYLCQDDLDAIHEDWWV